MTTAPAKLTPPRSQNVYERSRLFKLLDAGCKCPITWVISPAGAGKTTLIASYLQKQKREPLWYQIDAGDADISTFFSYLAQAASRQIAKPLNLPSFTSDYRAGSATFARNYFRAFFSKIGASSVIVFDNYQEVSSDNEFHKILQIGLAEIPHNINVIIISRENPPSEYSRMLASGTIYTINWNDIRLESTETIAIAKLRLGNAKFQTLNCAELHSQSQGWLAGLVLLLKNTDSASGQPKMNPLEGYQGVFDYFAGEIMSKSEPKTQQLLFATALLPVVSIDNASALCKLPDAEAILKDLTNRNYFTVCHSGSVPIYEYHPLFKKFLLAQGKSYYSEKKLLSLKISAANLLQASGYSNDAVQLLLEAKQWQESISLILAHAKNFIQQGSSKTLLTWIERLPESFVHSVPWLRYWKGMCHIGTNPKIARDCLGSAFYTFKSEADSKGQIVSFCSIVDTYIYERAEIQSLDKWLEEVSELITTIDDFNTSELSKRLSCAVFMALIYRQPDHPDLLLWEQRACDVVLSNADSQLRISIGNHLVLYYMWWISDKAKAEIIVKTLRPIIDKGSAPPLTSIIWQMIEAGYHWLVTGSDESLRSAQKGLDIGDKVGVHILDVYILTHAVFSGLCRRDTVVVDHYLHKMTSLIELDRFMDSSWYYFLCAWSDASKENFDSAFHYAELALEHSIKAGRPFMIANSSIAYAVLLYRRGAKQKAMQYVNEAEEIGEKIHSPTILYLANFAKMEFEISENGDNADLSQLEKCLHLGKNIGTLNISWFTPSTLIQFYSLALKNNLEKVYVLERIQKAGFPPLENTLPPSDWPYPVKIYTFSAFKIVINGKALIFSSKAQKKVLNLLKALIAYGAVEVNVETLCTALWPDANGDSAYQSFTITLQRLRKLILCKQALVLRDGKLSLDPMYSWIDAWVFERGIEIDDASAKEESVRLYQGSFLENDQEFVWVLTAREKFRRKYLRAVLSCGQNHLAQDNIQKATLCYEQGVEIEPLAEELYRPLLQGYIAQGYPAKAVALYLSYQNILWEHLGIEPGLALKNLYATLKSQ